MNGATHRAMQLHIELNKHIRVEDAGFRSVSDGSRLDYVSSDELKVFVLWHAWSSGHTVSRLHMAIALFDTTVVPFSSFVILEARALWVFLSLALGSNYLETFHPVQTILIFCK